ncbi:MAG: tol-pal system protein YbgF [candidate division Zixibacteria bacterium]|nr:tol-pal system protein YbgF [candidate division Zixibacteria bacterium]
MTPYRKITGQGYRLAAVSLIVMVFLAAGCASKQDVLRIEDKINQVRNDQRLLNARVERIDSLLSNSLEQDNRLRAEMMAAIDELTGQGAQIQNRIDDLQQLVYRTPGRAETGSAIQTPPDTTRTADTTRATPAKTDAAPSVDCRNLWDNAFKDMRRGQYDLAISGFSDYLKFCPKGELCDNSQYWIAEAYYEMKQYPRAIEEYDRLLTQYPDSEQRPSAYYKLGRCYEEKGDKKKALDHFLVLKKDFPNTPEYEQAKDRITALQKALKK